jgi:hypothetical protein
MEEVVRELSKNEDDPADNLFGLRFTTLIQGCCILFRGSDDHLPSPPIFRGIHLLGRVTPESVRAGLFGDKYTHLDLYVI